MTNPIDCDIAAYTAYADKVAKMICAFDKPDDRETLHKLVTEWKNIQDKLSMLEDLKASYMKERT